MYNPSGSALVRKLNRAEEFFKKYIAEHEDYKPGKLRHLKRLQKALKEAGFDDRMISPMRVFAPLIFFQLKRLGFK